MRQRAVDAKTAAARRPSLDPLWREQVDANDDIYHEERVRLRNRRRYRSCVTTVVTAVVLVLVFMAAGFIFMQTDIGQRFMNSRMFSTISYDDPEGDAIVYDSITGWFPWKFKIRDVHFRTMKNGKRTTWAFAPVIRVRIYSPWRIPFQRIARMHHVSFPQLLIDESVLKGSSHTIQIGQHTIFLHNPSENGDVFPKNQEATKDRDTSNDAWQTLPDIPWPSLSAKTYFRQFNVINLRVVNGTVLEDIGAEVLRARGHTISLPPPVGILDNVALSGKATVLGPNGNWELDMLVHSKTHNSTFEEGALNGQLVVHGIAQQQRITVSVTITAKLPHLSENCTVALAADVGGNLQSFNALATHRALLKGGSVHFHHDNYMEVRGCFDRRFASMRGAITINEQREVSLRDLRIDLEDTFVCSVNGSLGLLDKPSSWPLALNVSGKYLRRPGSTLDGHCSALRCQMEIADMLTHSHASVQVMLETETETRVNVRLGHIRILHHRLVSDFVLFIDARTRCIPWYKSASCIWTLQLDAPGYGRGNALLTPATRKLHAFSVSGSGEGHLQRGDMELSCTHLALVGSLDNVTLIASNVRAAWQSHSSAIIESAQVEMSVQFIDRLWQFSAESVGYARGSLNYENRRRWVMQSDRGRFEIQPFFHDAQIQAIQWHRPQTVIYNPHTHRTEVHVSVADERFTLNCTECALESYTCATYRVQLEESGSALLRIAQFLQPNTSMLDRVVAVDGRVRFFIDNMQLHTEILDGGVETDTERINDIYGSLNWVRTDAFANYAIRMNKLAPLPCAMKSDGILTHHNTTIFADGDTEWVGERITYKTPGATVEFQLSEEEYAFLLNMISRLSG